MIDRTALILDIFAQRARTREGVVQVALAQHEYLLPRLTGQWEHLERMEGAIGSRGPGETQLETDRRLIRNQIKRLKKDLERVRTHRQQHRNKRDRAGIPLVALVGYTNAGKSTLMNALTNANVRARDRLFETLDPTTRRCRLSEQHTVLLSDTVGLHPEAADAARRRFPGDAGGAGRGRPAASCCRRHGAGRAGTGG